MTTCRSLLKIECKGKESRHCIETIYGKYLNGKGLAAVQAKLKKLELVKLNGTNKLAAATTSDNGGTAVRTMSNAPVSPPLSPNRHIASPPKSNQPI